jgi:hypothetical protein
LDARWTVAADDRLVLVTLVIRLVAEELAKGEVIGRVEHVGSGEHATVHGLEELVSFARRYAAGDPKGAL